MKKKSCSYCGEKIEETERHYHSVTKGARGIFLCSACYENGYEPELERLPNGLVRIKSRTSIKDEPENQVKGE